MLRQGYLTMQGGADRALHAPRNCEQVAQKWLKCRGFPVTFTEIACFHIQGKGVR
jgi:hypothetical protein